MTVGLISDLIVGQLVHTWEIDIALVNENDRTGRPLKRVPRSAKRGGMYNNTPVDRSKRAARASRPREKAEERYGTP